jgi:tRNA nucleotidyltransferase (CCA-adding enzyme)
MTDTVELPSRVWALRRCAACSVYDASLAEDLEACREALAGASLSDFEPGVLREAFETLLLGQKPSAGFLALRDAGALSWMIPELAQGYGLSQNEYHVHDIFFHCIFACDASQPELALRLAGLLHDIGKSRTRRMGPDGVPTFHNHEVVGARQTVRILTRIGFDDALIDRVTFLVRNHMFHYTPDWTDQAVRKFMRRVSPEQMRDLIELRIADRKASGKRASVPRPVYDFLSHMERIRKEDMRMKVRDLAIDGHRLMELGMEPGPAMGDLLNALLERVTSGELENESAALESAALEMMDRVPVPGGAA